MATPFLLAIAGLGDTPRLVCLVNSAHRGDASHRGWTTEAHLLDGQRIDEAGVREVLAVPEAAMLLRLGPHEELRSSFHTQPTGSKIHLGVLAVSPDYQVCGVGKFLIQAAENHGRQHGCTVNQMTALSVRAELIAFYERLSYRQIGDTEPFPTDPRYGIPTQPLTLRVLDTLRVLERSLGSF